MPKPNTYCPFVKRPFEECHVTGLSSSAMEKAIYFCGGHYDLCEIYRKRIGSQKADSTESESQRPPE